MDISPFDTGTLNKKTPTGRILLACQVVGDGVGDFYHLLDLARNENNFMENYQKDVIIRVERPGHIEHFKKKLEKLGYNITIVDSLTSLENALHSKNLNHKIAIILNLDLSATKSKTAKILEFFYDGVIDISVPIALDLDIPRITITEHGKTSTLGHNVPMDLSTGTESIFLTEENRENPAHQLAEVLSKEENSLVLFALLKTSSKDPIEIEKKCELLLAENLFVPGYLQHSAAALINFINITTDSPLSQQYKSTVFFLNTIDFETLDNLKSAASRELFSKSVKEIIVKTKDGEQKIENPNANSDAKIVTLVSGYRIPDDEDYRKLYHCAQYFAGCSGDKSLELVLSNGLIPLFIKHKPYKLKFIENASKINEYFTFVVDLDAAEDSCRKALRKNEVSTKNETLDFLNYIKYSDEDLKRYKSEAQENVMFISNYLDHVFFEHWKKLCINLKENHNLHDKLPNIINTFFKKHGLEVSVDNTQSEKTQSKFKNK